MKIEEIKDRKGFTLKCGKNIIKLHRLEKHLYEFEKFQLINYNNPKLVHLLSEKFYDFIKKNKIVMMTENRKHDRKQNRFMRGCGFKIKYSTQLFTRSLKKINLNYKDTFAYLSINEIGIYKFFKLFKVSVENHIEQYKQFKKHINKMRKLIHNTYDIENWKAVSLNNVNIGIVMPHIYPENPEIGNILEIGLKPEFRGKGFGRIVHAHGLQLLKEMGAKQYQGSTLTTNYAMLRVFELNGCKKWFLRRFFYAE